MDEARLFANMSSTRTVDATSSGHVRTGAGEATRTLAIRPRTPFVLDSYTGYFTAASS